MWFNIEEQIFQRFKVQSTERKLLLWSMLLAFFVEGTRCYFDVVSMSLFLAHYSSKDLPKIYLFNAIFVAVMGSGYSLLASRMAFNRFIMILLLFLGGVTIGIGVLLTEIGSAWIFGLLIVWSIAAKSLLDLGLWSVFTQMYTLQQGKRLFGFIRASQGVGGMIAGFLLPVLLFVMTTERVVLLIGILVFLAMIISVKLLKTEGGFAESVSNTSDIESGKFASNIWHDKYILKILGIVFLGILAQYTIAVLFNALAKEYYPGKGELSSFLGVFSALGYGLTLLLNVFAYRWIMERFGVVVSAMLCPLLLLIIGIIILILNVIPSSYVFIFWLVALLRAVDLNFRNAISDSSNILLLQPLSPYLRKFVLSQTKMIMSPLAIGFISIVLMVMANTVGILVSWYVLGVVVFCLLSILINRALKLGYINSLSNAIKQRYTITSGFHFPSKESLPIFRQILLSPYPDEVLYALSSIEHIDKDAFVDGLKIAIKSQAEEIRHFALQKIREYRVLAFYDDLLLMLDFETNDAIKAQVLSTVADLNYEKARHKIHQLVKHASPVIYCAALIAMASYGDNSESSMALEKISNLLESEQETVRKSAAFIIGEINNKHTNKFLEGAVYDVSEHVQLEALRSVIKINYLKCFDEVLRKTYLLELNGRILQGFLALSNEFMPILKKNFSSYLRIDQLKLLYIMSKMQSTAAAAFLEKMVLDSHGELCQTALRSLKQISSPKSHIFYENIQKKINEEVDYLKQHYGYLQITPVLDLTQVLRDTLHRKIALSVERLLLLIAMEYGDKSIMEVQARLDIGTVNEIGYALELLQEIISAEHKASIVPILDSIYLTEAPSKGKLDSTHFNAFIKTQLQEGDKEYLTILSCIACLYIIKTIGTKPFVDEIMQLKRSEVAIIQETVMWLES